MNDSSQTTSAQVEQSAGFSNAQWVVYALFVAAGLLLRWLELDVRPIHHDESLHAMYGIYFYDWPREKYYQYDPMLHGPLLYNLYPLVYYTLGISDWSIRAPIALLGSLFIFVPWFFRRYLSNTAVIAVTAAVALSPTLIYWSRLIHHDEFVLLGWLMMLAGVLLFSARYAATFVLGGIAIQWVVKANVYITLALLLGYIVYEVAALAALEKRLGERLKQMRQDITANSLGWISGLAAMAVMPLLPIQADYAVILTCVCWLLGFPLAGPRLRSFFLFAGAALLWRVMDDPKIGAALYLCVLALELLCLLAHRLDDRTLLKRALTHCAENRAAYALGALWAVLVYCYFYTSGFRYSAGILDGLYRKGISYWLHQHSIERIVGPFMFHFYVLSWYELPFILVLLLHTVCMYAKANSGFRWAGGLCLFLAVIAFLALPSADVPNFPLWKLFRLKDRLDVLGFVFIVSQSLLVTTYHLTRRELKLAFFGYMFYATFFAYNYAGEKTPWLSIYPFVCGIAYFAVYFDDFLKRHPLPDWNRTRLDYTLIALGSIALLLSLIFVLQDGFSADTLASNVRLVGLSAILLGLGLLDWWIPGELRYNLRTALFVVLSVYSLRAAIITNYVNAGAAKELLSQVHTAHEYDMVFREIRRELLLAPEERRPQVLASGEGVWPTVWYLRNLPLRYEAKEDEKKNYKYILQDWKEGQQNVPAGFESRKLKLRGWWVPDYSVMTLRKFLIYAISHEPWAPKGGGDPTGYSYVTLLTRTDPR